MTALPAVVVFGACSSTSDDASIDPRTDAGLKRDTGLVDPPDSPDGGIVEDADAPAPSCDTYCDLVMERCQGDDLQYRDRDECIGICSQLPTGKSGESDTPTVGCRAQFAGSPAKTDPSKYCAAAGPTGGGECGDRCTAFCQLAIAECAPDAGNAPYASYASCLTACAGYQFDGDAGDPEIDGPTAGDTLNCRFFYVRKELRGEQGCASIGSKSPDCK